MLPIYNYNEGVVHMIRYDHPFNGKQYLLNKNTGEIHDLMNEKSQCKIDEINHTHIHMTDSYEAAYVYGLYSVNNVNGCRYCIPCKDKG